MNSSIDRSLVYQSFCSVLDYVMPHSISLSSLFTITPVHIKLVRYHACSLSNLFAIMSVRYHARSLSNLFHKVA